MGELGLPKETRSWLLLRDRDLLLVEDVAEPELPVLPSGRERDIMEAVLLLGVDAALPGFDAGRGSGLGVYFGWRIVFTSGSGLGVNDLRDLKVVELLKTATSDRFTRLLLLFCMFVLCWARRARRPRIAPVSRQHTDQWR